jgi:hypothetical protein
MAPLEMKEGTPLGARAQSSIQRAAVLYIMGGNKATIFFVVTLQIFLIITTQKVGTPKKFF